MRTQRSQVDPQVVTAGPEAPAPVSTRAWLTERIDLRVAIGLFVAWLVLPEIAYLLEPPARGSEPFFGLLLEISMNVLFVATLAGLVARRRWGLAVSLAGAVLATAASIACPVSGHHGFGAWWYGQMACMLALVGMSAAALSRATKAQPKL